MTECGVFGFKFYAGDVLPIVSDLGKDSFHHEPRQL